MDRPLAVLRVDHLDRLTGTLARRGYQVIGPTVRDGAIVYDRIGSADDLPVGWTDEQGPGRYRLKRRTDGALFGYAAGPTSLKNHLHPSEVRMLAAERCKATFRILDDEPPHPSPRAFLGVRSCELAAIAVLDRVLLGDRYRDPTYGALREGAFVVAVQCTEPASTCFCASMGNGPPSKAGFDLALTELLEPGGHRFLVEVGSDRGAEVLAELEPAPATAEEEAAARAAVAAGVERQVRSLERDGLAEFLPQALEHPRWDEVAGRCLACANCTMVCPTCFCTTVDDLTDVAGRRAERWRRWDSCFTLSFSYIHGGSVRASGKARYRQWLTHKLASWHDQFGLSGCVGCGRCITWCPAGIDLTEEVRVLRGTERHGNA
ncbi:MAG TPA: 4Fe-4S dicluster domain-containing protein [Anaeromyxobacter sp.]|nr:4Fe-4S dicluster domain-containing protein [Anaeromyxobacter sp.]